MCSPNNQDLQPLQFIVPVKKTNEFTFGTINVRTMKCDTKCGSIGEIFHGLRMHILFLQEVRRTGHGLVEIDNETRMAYCGYARKVEAGVAIMMSKEVELVDIHYMSARILAVTVKIKSIKLYCVCAYSPTECANDAQKDCFYKDLRRTIKLQPNGYKLLVCGDMNATIGKGSYGAWNMLGQVNLEEETNDNGTRLLGFSAEYNLKILNSFFSCTKPELRIPTWRSGTGIEKRLDYILLDRFLSRYATKWRTRRQTSKLFNTDHYLLEAVLSLPKTKSLKSQNAKKKRPKEQVDVSVLTNAETETAYCEKLQEILGPDSITDVDIDELAEEICDATKTAAEITCPKLLEEYEKQPWKDDKLREMKKGLRKLEGAELREAQKKIKEYEKQLLNRFYEKKALAINQSHIMRQVAREYKQIKDFSVIKKTSKIQISKAKLYEHFSEHFGGDDLPIPPELENPDGCCLKNHQNKAHDIEQGPPVEEEVEQALRRLNNQKCVGVDGVRLEQLKYGRKSAALMQKILLLMATIWSCFTMPKVWLEGKIVCIFKKGSAMLAKNYIGLTVTANLSRIIPMVILRRLEGPYNELLDQSQCGFRKNCGTNDAIHTLLSTIHNTGEQHFLLFVDLRAAYDSIPRNILFRSMEVRLGCRDLIRILQAMYTNTVAKISGYKRFFPVRTGCRQGGIESPLAFNILLDTACLVLQDELESKLGSNYGLHYQFTYPSEVNPRSLRRSGPSSGKTVLYKTLYADDLVLIFKTKPALQLGLETTEAVFKRFGLNVSRDKTETMVVNGEKEDAEATSICEVGGFKIKHSQEFKYLGTMIRPEGITRTIEHRIASAIGKWCEFKKLLRDGRIKVKTRAKYLIAFVRSRLTYSCATWNVGEGVKNKLDAEWMKYLRRMVKGGYRRKDDSFRFYYSNLDILRITGCITISEYMEKQRLKWLGHCVRMQNNAMQKTSLFMIPTKKNVRSFWLQYEKRYGMDQSQLRRLMMDKAKFDGFLALNFKETALSD